MDQDLIGSDLAYPIRLRDDSEAEIVTGTALLQQSIIDILSTPEGSRFDNPYYGSKCHTLLFEPNDEIVESFLDSYIAEALGRWETRVKYEFTIFEKPNPELLNCLIHTVNKITKANEVYTFPFYRNLAA